MCDYVCLKSRCHLFAYKMCECVCVFDFTDSPFILIHSFSHSVSPLYSSPTENEWMADAPSFERGRISKYKWWWWWWWPRKPGQYRYLVEVYVCILFRIWFLSSAFMLSSSMSTVITERVFAPVCSPHCLTPSTSAASLRSCVLAVCLAVYCLLNECASASVCLPICRCLVMSSHLSNLVRFFLFFSIDWRAQSVPVFAPPSPPTWVCLHWWSILSFFLSAYLIPSLRFIIPLLQFGGLSMFVFSFFYSFLLWNISISDVADSAAAAAKRHTIAIAVANVAFCFHSLLPLLSPSRTPLCRPASLFCCRRQLFGCLISQCYLFFFFKRQH